MTFNSLVDQWENQGKLETKGLEINLKYSTKNLNTYFNYTFTDSEDDSGNREPEISRHSANIGLTCMYNKNWKFNIRGNYLGKRETRQIILATGSDDISSAFVVHASLTCMNYGNWNFQITGKNLLDKRYYHTSNRPPERYRQPQRTLLFKVQYRL